ncbi:MAG: hypothetical protein OSB14_06655 [Planctomycetota bacterium]|nr:hypothetical protein [Planctomycetota bacterium]
MITRALLSLTLLASTATAQTEVFVEISEVDLVNKNFTVHVELAADLAGFQFDVSGVEVTGASGGLAENASFQTSFNCDPNICRVLSFGFGTQIDAGANGDLIIVDFDCPGGDCSNGVTICLFAPVFASPAASELESELGPCVEAGLGNIYCVGDGSATPCPCGNTSASGGCANSTGVGGTMTAYGSVSVSADDLTFSATGLIPSQPVLLFVGNNAVNSGAGNSFGDGLRCAGGGVRRLGVRFCDSAGSANWEGGLNASGGWSAGDLQRFQGWYRDASGPCGSTFNLTQGLELTFQA